MKRGNPRKTSAMTYGIRKAPVIEQNHCHVNQENVNVQGEANKNNVIYMIF